jgi:hypothetical protein
MSARVLAAAALIGALVLSAACGAPFERSKARMEQLALARRQASGAWIVLRYGRERPPRTLEGELLAANPDSIFLLTSAGVGAMPSRELKWARITLYEAPSKATGPPVRVIRLGRQDDWGALASHARFPQGLPADFDRDPPVAP